MVLFRQDLFRNYDPMQVGFHQVTDQVNLVAVRILLQIHVQDVDDILMLQAPQELHLANEPLTIHQRMMGVMPDGDLLNGHLGLTGLKLDHGATCTGPNLLDQLKTSRHLKWHSIDRDLLPSRAFRLRRLLPDGPLKALVDPLPALRWHCPEVTGCLVSLLDAWQNLRACPVKEVHHKPGTLANLQ